MKKFKEWTISKPVERDLRPPAGRPPLYGRPMTQRELYERRARTKAARERREDSGPSWKEFVNHVSRETLGPVAEVQLDRFGNRDRRD